MALIARIGFWGPLYYDYRIRNPPKSVGNYFAPTLLAAVVGFGLAWGLGLCAFVDLAGRNGVAKHVFVFFFGGVP